MINVEFILLMLSILTTSFLIHYILKRQPISQLNKAFIASQVCVFIVCVGVFLQLISNHYTSIDPIYFENFIYIGTCFFPVALFFVAIIFKNTKIKFKKSYIIPFIIPIITLIVLYTNNFHHLFYQHYSSNLNEMVYGSYFFIHTVYTYALLLIDILIMVNVSLKNSGFFSKQTLLIILGAMIPVLVNVFGTLKIIEMSVCMTPISVSATIIFYTIAIVKFNFLSITPIALKKIVDRMSDSYVVLDEDNIIIDFNKTFIETFKVKEKLRGINFIDFLNIRKDDTININKIQQSLVKTKKLNKTVSFEQQFGKIEKIFTLEFSPINSEKNFIGTLVLLKDITQHKKDMETIKNNQYLLIERERLASLGQLIGGIAHNLKTPIMSISGALEALEDLIKEYDKSIDSPIVTSADHHEIAKDMESWIPKIRTYIEYMSDIITTVRGQAVALSNQENMSFTVEELVKKVDILMKHELKKSFIYLNILMKTDENQTLDGDVNSLVQVVNNIISNAIQAYDGKQNQNIELEVSKNEYNIIFSIKDWAGGLSKEVQDKIFKEMVTTKGKNGTGLGLYMSYSNIKARFGGDITFETEEGKGTTFNIILPIKNVA